MTKPASSDMFAESSLQMGQAVLSCADCLSGRGIKLYKGDL
jgi:hypothetical protein